MINLYAAHLYTHKIMITYHTIRALPYHAVYKRFLFVDTKYNITIVDLNVP